MGKRLRCWATYFIDGIEKPFVVGAPTEWNYTSCDVSPEGSYVVMGGTQNLLRVASLLPKTNKKGNLEPSLIRKDAPGIPDSVRRVACHPSKPVLAPNWRNKLGCQPASLMWLLGLEKKQARD